MNYRHAYHAGNHTEVFKHSVLCLLIAELLKKSTPITVLDTHAGAGQYDLLSPEAQKTKEYSEGIGTAINRQVPSASIYLDIVRNLNPAALTRYPGSPSIVRRLLRNDDRMIACELRRVDFVRLYDQFKDDRRVSVHCRDGYEAIRALVPLASRRGLVFVDPPFERTDEFELLAKGMKGGASKWPTGMFAAWYPIKDRIGSRSIRKKFDASDPPVLCCEFLREPIDGVRLAGSGMLICNPPWRFEEKLSLLCKDLSVALDAPTAESVIEWWVRERN